MGVLPATIATVAAIESATAAAGEPIPELAPRRTRAGVYHALVLGPPGRRTQIILLDTRYFRSPLRPDGGGGYLPQHDPGATMLGEVQWKWFAEQLRVPADLRLVVSSIQVQH